MTLTAVKFWRTKKDKELNRYEMGLMINNDAFAIDKEGKIVQKLYDFELQTWVFHIQNLTLSN
jgi:hypothetical protein